MKMRRRLVLVGVALVVVATAGTIAMHPLWYLSQSGVKSWLLRKVPAGSSVDQLKSVALAEGWRVNNSWSGDQPHADWAGISGSTIVWTDLGGYRILFRVDYDSFWAFDANGRLVDVRVRKMVDAL